MSKGGKLGLAIAVAGVLAWRRVRPFTVAVQGDSMLPTLADGDWLIALAAAHPAPGALVVVEHPLRPGFEMVKRFDHFEADGELWLVGDNTDATTDSRTIGPFDEGRVRGVVVCRYRPVRRVRIFGVRHRAVQAAAPATPGPP